MLRLSRVLFPQARASVLVVYYSLVRRTAARTVGTRPDNAESSSIGSQQLQERGAHVADAIFALKGRAESDPEMRAALECAHTYLTAGSSALDPPGIARLVNGLHACSPSSLLVSAVLAAAVRCIEATPPAEFHARDVAMVLSGFSLSRSNGHYHVRRLLAVLATAMKGCTGSLNAQEVGDALYGLKFCGSSHREVRQMLGALAPKIVGCTETFDAQAVGSTLSGLRNCSSSVPEVCEVLSALAPKIAGCTEVLDPRAIGRALYGLQSISSQAPEVREVLRVLASKIAHCTQAADARTLGSLIGLQSCSSDVSEVRDLLAVLTPLLLKCPDPLAVHDVVGAFLGLREIAPAFRKDLLSMIAPYTVRLASSSAGLSNRELSTLVHGLVALRLSASQSIEQQLSAFRDACIAELARRIPDVDKLSFESLKNPFRVLSGQIAARHFAASSPSGHMHSHGGPEYLHGYTADIVIRIRSPDGTLTVVNVEIDYAHWLGVNQRKARRRMVYIRDEFLRSHGVVVKRWGLDYDGVASWAMQSSRFGNWLVGILRRSTVTSKAPEMLETRTLV
jgi:hypothetical protein